ncbi:MAG: Hsp20/alpha crystallin family protein [Flavobacteriales bacterium]|nr:Hsp20/alpha crystallin family protein [Flavobacteriales bacterium]
MTLIKWKKNDLFPASGLSDFFDDILNHKLQSAGGRSTVPAVNISEQKDAYELEVSAPGFEKADFQVDVENDLLTISGKHQSEKTEDAKNYSRKEFAFGSFNRSFTLPEIVKADEIRATYEKGILTVVLPKKDEAKAAPVRKIEVA